MRPVIVAVVVVLVAAALRAQEGPTSATGTREVVVMRIEGPIGPATARFLAEGIDTAENKNAAALVIELDTPGGLATSMGEMTRDMLASNVPVIVHVTPRGARAASAGTFLVYASHVAAMAHATNLGAATPIAIGGPPGMPGGDEKPEGPSAAEHKALNDAAAQLRALAELRGRDVAFAEAAVRDAATLSASQALERGVIDLIADDRSALLAAIDGRTVQLAGFERVIDTDDVVVSELTPTWQSRVLSVIANPNVAYLLFMFGFFGILYELASPGAVFPGVAGAISLVLALFALAVLPVTFAGAVLLLLGLGLLIAEAVSPSFGAFGAGGLIAFVIGSLLLIDVDAPGFQVSRALIIGVAGVTAVFVVVIMRLGFKARHRPIVSGREQMIGGVAVAAESFDDHGTVHIHGEVWSADTEAPLVEGQPAKVVAMKGLVLRVRPLLLEPARGTS